MPITKGPLHGIRVLDLTQAHAGPFGTMLLGDLGAEIIKIEPPKGEMMRGGEPKVSVLQSYLIGLNRNKKGVVLDLKSETGKKTFYDLVKKSDIVYSNYRADVPKRMGNDFDTLKKYNPKIIRCNISGYGATGPYTGYPSYDIIGCGHSGILSISGEPGHAPLIPGGIALADMIGGIFATMSVLAALIDRNKTGKGMPVEVNLLDGLLVMQQVMFQQYLLTGNEPGLQGRRHPIGAGYGIYDTLDGNMTIASLDQEKVMTLIGLGEMLSDPLYETPTERMINKDSLDKLIEDALKKKNTDDWVNLLRDENDIACGPILNFEQILKDPQIAENKTFIEMDLKGEKYKTVGSIFRLSNEDGDLIAGTPDAPADLGEHTDLILKTLLDYSSEEIDEVHNANNGQNNNNRAASNIKMVYEHELEEETKKTDG